MDLLTTWRLTWLDHKKIHFINLGCFRKKIWLSRHIRGEGGFYKRSGKFQTNFSFFKWTLPLEGCNDNTSVSSKLCQNTLTRLGIAEDEAAKYHAILQNNTFRRESGRCLCPAMAMLNHNCDPNCRVYWSGKNCNRWVVHNSRSIFGQ